MFLSAATCHLLLFPSEHALKASRVPELKVTWKSAMRAASRVVPLIRPAASVPAHFLPLLPPPALPPWFPVLQRAFMDECKFRETLLPNNYNAYESFVYKGFYVALSKHGRVKKGNRATTAMTVTHFLPRL